MADEDQQHRGGIAATEVIAEQFDLATVASVPAVPEGVILFQLLRDRRPADPPWPASTAGSPRR